MALPTSLQRRLFPLNRLGLLVFVVALLWMPGAAAMPAGQESSTPAGDAVQLAVTVAAGETARVPFRAYSLDVQRPLPAAGELASVAGPADPAIISVLGQAIQRDLVAAADLSERFQPQAAIWRLGAEPEVLVCLDYYTGQSIDLAVADELVAGAQGEAAAPEFAVQDENAVPLQEALSRGLAVESFEFSSPDSQIDPRLPSCFTRPPDRGQLADRRFAGEGAIVVRNDGEQAITLYLATGAIIEPGPDSPTGRLVAYSVTTGQPGPADQTPEPAPETPASATAVAVSDITTPTAGSEATPVPVEEASPAEPAAGEETPVVSEAETHGEAEPEAEAASSGAGSWIVGIAFLLVLIGGGILALRK